MRRYLIIGILLVLFFSLLGAKHSPSDYRIYDLHQGKEAPLSEVITELKKNQIILVGEHHSNKVHHLAQLAVIQMLKEAGARVAVGLEMFRSDSQKALDRWIAGEIDEKEFQAIYYENWNFPWPAYSMIFDYAKANRIPMIGLNVPREITRQVSRKGFQSLTDEQKGKLSNVSCRVDEEYMKYIKKAFGGHGHGNLNFTYFCEAQLVWDNVMAVNALDYLQKHPDAVVVILTGTGHARKGAVPRQIRERSNVPHAVILPEVKGGIDPDTIDTKDADYIMLEL